jgi:hypothetical protein
MIGKKVKAIDLPEGFIPNKAKWKGEKIRPLSVYCSAKNYWAMLFTITGMPG